MWDYESQKLEQFKQQINLTNEGAKIDSERGIEFYSPWTVSNVGAKQQFQVVSQS